jgi:2-desacetyl-2-hydroxyethyl bacteriochlorophyllide A dehydrogenase
MAKSTIRAVEIDAHGIIAVVERARPEPAADEILIAPAACGICGTDLHIMKAEFPQAVYPVVPGHELSGIVVSSGHFAAEFPIGSLVAVDPNVVCGECRFCLAGRPNLCVKLQVIGVTRQGAASELLAVPARNAFVVPDEAGPEVAAMIEPLACAVNATERAGDLRGRRILVMGAGTMGLLIAVLARHLGAGEVWVSDPAEAKHAIAHAVGIGTVVLPSALADERFDIVFEAAGALPAARQVMDLLHPMGVWMQIGVHAPEATVGLRPFDIFERELSIIGSNSLADKFPAAVALMPQMREAARALVTSRFSVWDFDAAVRSMAGAGSVKTQLTFSTNS